MKYIQKPSMKVENVKSVMQRMESMISDLTADSFREGWDTGIYLDGLMEGLTSLFHDSTIHSLDREILIKWESLKLDQEPDHPGLVGFIFTIRYHDGEVIEGAWIMDLKLRDVDKNSFTNLRKDHLKRFHSLSFPTHLLLADYDMIAGMAFPTLPEAIIGNYPHSWNSWTPFTHLASVASSTVLALGSKTASLYKVSLPFSYQLCYRLIHGMDLDHTKSAIDFTSGQREEKGLPAFITRVQISHGPWDLPVTETRINDAYVSF